MKGTSYVSLARNYSFVILLTLYLAFTCTTDYVPKMYNLFEARQAFAAIVVDGKDADENFFEPAALEKNIKVYEIYSVKLVRDSTNSPGIRQIEVTGLGRRWRINRPFKTADESTTNLQTVYKEQLGENAKPEDGPVILFGKIEHNIFVENKTKVPIIDLEFQSSVAAWLLSFIVIGIMVQIRHNARRTLFDPDLAIDEPWLLLDGRRGLEKFVALGWLLGIALAPWIANGCLFAVFTAQLWADGGMDSIGLEICILFCCVVISVVSGWCSLTTMAELLRLRRLRLAKVKTLSDSF